MATFITAHLQILKCPQFLHFSTDLDETGIKIHGLLRSYIINIIITRVAVPFKLVLVLCMLLKYLQIAHIETYLS